MNKSDLLQAITASAKEGLVSQEEIVNAYNEGIAGDISGRTSENRVGISQILYYLGGGVVAVGISIFIEQNWETLSVFTRILSTLGAGIMAYIIGVVLSRADRHASWGQAFHLIAALVLPIGLFVTLDQLGVEISEGITSGVFALLSVWYLLSYHVFRKNIFMLFGVIFTTLLFFALTDFLASGTVISHEGDFISYQFLITGMTYILLGYAFVHRQEAPLTKYLYSFGIVFLLGAALSLGGYAPEQNWFWEIIFPGLALGATFLSLPLHSRAFLIFGALFLVGYIFKITGEYFTEGLGWPLALVLAGFALIAVGALFVRLNNRYKTSERNAGYRQYFLSMKQVSSTLPLKVKRSSAGLGLFALAPIKKNQTIIEYVGERVPTSLKRENRYIFSVNNRWDIDGSSRSNTARYINHACRPNCEAINRRDRIFIVAKRSIKAGEELTYNYGKDYFNEYIGKNHCLCATCVKRRK